MTQPKKRNVLNPLDLVIVSRTRLHEVFDDAVSRGRMTRDDATELAAELIRRGRSGTVDALGDIEQLLGRSREHILSATGLSGSFPIDDYDDLSAAQVRERLEGLGPSELRRVQEHERRNANRKTVLQAIEAKLS